MERLKKARTPLRTAITRTINEAKAELTKDQPDHQVLALKLGKLERVLPEVTVLDQKILDIMLDEDVGDDAYGEETSANLEYQDNVDEVKYLIDKVLHPASSESPSSPNASEFGSALSVSGKKRNYKLPKIEIKKFNGELTEWLSFWSQFQKIHDDEELHETDKFQYLVQSMVKETRAHDLVSSYPQTADNYPKVAEALKRRFGKEKILKQVYVRELLKLVITNNTSREKVPVVQLYDRLESHLRALESLGVSQEQTGVFLYPMVESSLREDLLIAWQRSPLNGLDGSNEIPPKNELNYLMEFLRKEVENEDQRLLAQCGFAAAEFKEKNKGKVSTKMSKSKDQDIPTVAGLHIGDKTLCIFCERNHESKDCGSGTSMSLEDKQNRIKAKRACFNCLKTGHSFKTCKVFVKCQWCLKKHHGIMCPELPAHRKKESPPSTTSNEENKVVGDHMACTSQVILGTLQGSIIEGNRERQVRIFYDNGSQRNYILKRVADELKLKSDGEESLIHSVFGGVKTGVQKHRVFNIKLQNADKKGFTTLPVLDKDQICGEIPRMSRGPWMSELKQKGIWISDIGEKNPEIDILIGVDMFAKLLTGRKHQLKNGLMAVQTTLGWTLMGKCNESHNYNTESMGLNVISLSIAEATATELWSLETIGIKDPSEAKSKEEKELAVKEHFKKTVTRNEDGRYSVRLPWINGVQEIPNNRMIAEKRLESTTRKLKQEGKYEDYESIFNSWMEEGIIEEVNVKDINKASHYLPHRPVFKPESKTTPVRPVFDASCKTGRAPSLNDCLEKGPNLMELIPAVLHRFRMKKIGVISDIRKAFQMIEVDLEDRDYLRFLWWEDPTANKFKVYRHRRVVFGVNCSPFLLAAVLEHHLESIQDERKEIAKSLLESLYVDNCITSVDSYEEYKEFKKVATELLASAKMDLREWECTSGEESGIGSSSECGLVNGRSCIEDPMTSVLGLKWNKKEDSLSVVVPQGESMEKVTKRGILSEIQKLYDPLGFLSPALLPPKLLMQKLWAEKTDWDQEVDDPLKEEFLVWRKESKILGKIQLPRYMAMNNVNPSIEIHCFGDASKEAYAATIFLRVEDEDEVSVQLIQAKTRVAPLKTVTIPRLELLSSTITTRLATSVMKALGVKEVPTYFWSDSTTALAWIKGNDDWGTFVGNRVKEICSLSNSEDWRHVPGLMNPADLHLRGCSPLQLLESRWWEGPAWLKGPQDKWPSFIPEADEELVKKEVKKKTISNMGVTVDEDPWYLRRYSSFTKNVRLIGWVRRFMDKALKRSKESGELTMKEMEEAEKNIYRLVQGEVFPEKAEVIGGLKVEKESDLFSVKTRLLYREDCVKFKKPILLPHSHPCVDQIIREHHLTHHHAGVQFLLSHIRESCWIIQGRKAIKKIVGSCVRCRRFSVKVQEVPTAPLPGDRVNSARVFQVTGVDLAGPLFLKDGKKSWIVLFTCAVYRCVHLELVQNLQTDTFLLALHRFICRRGRPTTIYSDNGTNFVGAVNAFKTLDWKLIEKDTRVLRIQWKFNPPSAPWWGGWWERLIRIVKDLLKRTLGNQRLNYVQLESCLCELEATVNARPLTYITEDQEDLIPLTPGMFIQDIQDSSFPEDEVLGAVGFRKAYNDLKVMREQLRSRFRKEYLSQLVQRGKEKKTCAMKVGDVVLVGSDNKKRIYWPMAKILELLPGKDKKVRVARVKTSSGILIRPLQRLYPLEVSSEVDHPPISEEVKAIAVKKAQEAKEEPEVFTRAGRKCKKPQRYEA